MAINQKYIEVRATELPPSANPGDRYYILSGTQGGERVYDIYIMSDDGVWAKQRGMLTEQELKLNSVEEGAEKNPLFKTINNLPIVGDNSNISILPTGTIQAVNPSFDFDSAPDGDYRPIQIPSAGDPPITYGTVQVTGEEEGQISIIKNGSTLTKVVSPVVGFAKVVNSTNFFDKTGPLVNWASGMNSSTVGIIWGAFMNASGVVSQNADYFVTDFINIGQPGVNKTFSGFLFTSEASTSIRARTLFNSSLAVIGGTVTPENNFTTTASNVRLTIHKRLFEDFMLVFGTTKPEYYSAGGKAPAEDTQTLKVKGEQVIPVTDPYYLRKDTTDIAPINTNFLVKTSNLFVEDPLDGYTEGAFISDTTGALVFQTGFVATNWIPVTAGQQFTVSHARRYAFYNSDKSYLSGANVTEGVNFPFTYTAPANAAWYRQGVRLVDKDSFMAVAGATLPETYVKGGYTFTDNIVVNESEQPKQTIHIWGTSSVAGVFPSLLATASGRNIVAHGYAGQRSSVVRDAYLDSAPAIKALPQIFWISRNNTGFGENAFVDTSLSDLKRMIDATPHDNFLVIGPQTRDDSSENIGQPMYEKFVELETELRKAYGSRFINIREALANSWDYRDYRITTSFVQPSLGSNVTVTTNKAYIPLPVGTQRIKIGWRNEFDIYTIISATTTSWTLRLDVSNRISPGQTVQNLSFGTSIVYLTVVGERDDADRRNGRWPASLRADDIHATSEGYQLMTPFVIDAINKYEL